MFLFRNKKPLRRLRRKWQGNLPYILVRMGMNLSGSKMYSLVGFDVSDVEYSGSSSKDLENAGLIMKGQGSISINSNSDLRFCIVKCWSWCRF
jgi:hypothetical protein